MRTTVFYSVLSCLLAVAVSAFVKPDSTKNLNSSYAIKNIEAGKWVVDKLHTKVKFSVKHLVVSEVEGSFTSFDGSMENTQPHMSDAKVVFTVAVNSITTGNKLRDKHLRSDDFFNAAIFPTMKFESTSMNALDSTRYELTGNLTIRDVTKPVVFKVIYKGAATDADTSRIHFDAKTAINRFDYNLKWNKLTETGKIMVGENVNIDVDVELNKIESEK